MELSQNYLTLAVVTWILVEVLRTTRFGKAASGEIVALSVGLVLFAAGASSGYFSATFEAFAYAIIAIFLSGLGSDKISKPIKNLLKKSRKISRKK